MRPFHIYIDWSCNGEFDLHLLTDCLSEFAHYCRESQYVTSMSSSPKLSGLSLGFDDRKAFELWFESAFHISTPVCNVLLDIVNPYDMEFVTTMQRNNIGVYITDNRPNGNYEVNLFSDYDTLRFAIISMWEDEDLITLIER